MQLTVFEQGFNFSQDGPGNRLVLHLQGCNLRCPWCANPEGMAAQPPLMQRTEELPGWICPHGAIRDNALDRGACAPCPDRACVTRNPNRHLTCRAVTKPVEEWFSQIQSAAPLFFSGGGVTLTGGEVGVQLPAATELLRLCREAGIHTAIESNLSIESMPRIYPRLDLLIADYKHHDAARLDAVCGGSLDVIERNFCLALDAGLPVLLRIPLIGGFNDGVSDRQGFVPAIRRIAAHGPAQLSVELLTYHEYGVDKWAQCGLQYKMKEGAVSPESVRALREALANAGLKVIST